MSDFVTISTKIGEVLNSVKTATGQLAAVYDFYNSANDAGYPYASFEMEGIDDQYLTTGENIKIKKFTIAVINAVPDNGRAEATATLMDIIDSIIKAFDDDFTLGGTVLKTNITNGVKFDTKEISGRAVGFQFDLDCTVVYTLT